MDLHDLPTLNACLNATAGGLLVAGYVFIRRGARRAHRNCMVSACAASAVFLASYLVYHAQVGSVRFAGTGALRTTYLAILLTHTVLAAAVPVLAAITLVRALRERFDQHRRIARVTLPIWLYVSATGVIVYWMLYHLEVGS